MVRWRGWAAFIPQGNPRVWQVNRNHRVMGGWRYRAWFDFYNPSPNVGGFRWGLVIAWGDVPADWFEQT